MILLLPAIINAKDEERGRIMVRNLARLLLLVLTAPAMAADLPPLAGIDLDRILAGTLTAQGRASGFHHAPSGTTARVLCAGAPDAQGVYQARIVVADGTGRQDIRPLSTMFPDAWDRDTITAAIRRAYAGGRARETDGGALRWWGCADEACAVQLTGHVSASGWVFDARPDCRDCPPPACCGTAIGDGVIDDVTLIDFRADTVVHQGPIDLKPTLARILADRDAPVGQNDGTRHCARELGPRGGETDWVEYVVLPALMPGAGVQRLVIGLDSGQAWYSCDHYRSFVPLPRAVPVPARRAAAIRAAGNACTGNP